MIPLLPFRREGSRLFPEGRAFIAANRLMERRLILSAEDMSNPWTAEIYDLAEAAQEDQVLLQFDDEVDVSRCSFEVALPPELLGRVRARLRDLPGDRYEIFPVDHNVNEGFHFPDPWGEASELLQRLERVTRAVRPPVNHNKVSSRKRDRYDLQELHVDSFEGMRLTNGRRTKIWRYFINLGEQERLTTVVPFHPIALDNLLSTAYHPGYLDRVLQEAGGNIPVLVLSTPRRESHRVHALKLCTTHLLHGEYGQRGDFLAIINSLE